MKGVQNLKSIRNHRSLHSMIFPMVAFCALIAVAACGCHDHHDACPDGNGKIAVMATIFPIADIIKNIGGNYVVVTCLLPPGADPHTFEPTASQVKNTSQADIFFCIGGGLDDWATKLSDAAAERKPQLTRLMENMHESVLPFPEHDSARVENPHIWLDPLLVRDHIVPIITEELSHALPQMKECFAENSAAYQLELTALDREINKRFTSLKRRSFISYHSAWVYFAARYELEETAVISEHPGEEPSPRWVAELIDLAREHAITTIFAEPQTNTAMAESIAAEIGGHVSLLDPVGGEGIPGRSSYLELMRYNTDLIAEGFRE